MRKLAQLNVAGRTADLRVPPGNRLEALSGKRKGQSSLRINDQWRVCFKFEGEGGNALDVKLSIITEEADMSKRQVPYPIPGEILLQEFLKPMGLTQYRLAKEIGVPQRRIGEIIAGKRAVTTDTGLRLSRFFCLSVGFWERLQLDYD